MAQSPAQKQAKKDNWTIFRLNGTVSQLKNVEHSKLTVDEIANLHNMAFRIEAMLVDLKERTSNG